MITKFIKKKPSISKDYEKNQDYAENDITVEYRKKNAYKNEPGQFLLILSDISNLNISFDTNFKAMLSNQIKSSTLDELYILKHYFYCINAMKLLDKCEFYEFKDNQYDLFIETLRTTDFLELENFHVENSNINETVYKTSLEAPIEIFHRLGKSKDFESVRILIKNGALRRWISTMENAKSGIKKQHNNHVKDEITESEPDQE